LLFEGCFRWGDILICLILLPLVSPDVAPESMIIRFSILLASLLFHLFGLSISFTGILYVMLASSSSFLSSSVSFD